MVFSSPSFLFLFLPLFCVLYFIVPRKAKNVIILLASLLFYYWNEGYHVLILILSTFFDYAFGHIIGKGYRKIGLSLSLFTNLSFLLFFKYSNFIVDNLNLIITNLGIPPLAFNAEITLPIGISFFTFQTMSYSIDVFYGRVSPSRSITNFGTYVCLFPQLIAGPIVRYISIEKEIKSRTETLQASFLGVERFIYGLFKKVIIADNLGRFADIVFTSELTSISTFYSWLGILAYSFQIYYDFSGYSDMAIGLCKVLGFNIPENFDYPYISKSIKEFWRRWHISLSSWFRDYLYIPLGGNRKGPIRTYINLFIVFFVTGLWHGASWNFVFWGLFHGLFIVLERIGLSNILEKIPKVFSFIYTMLVVIIGWVFFRSEGFDFSLGFLSKMFLQFDTTAYSLQIEEQINIHLISVFILAIIFSIPIFKLFDKKVNKFSLTRMITSFALLLISVIYIAGNTYSPFIYFRF